MDLDEEFTRRSDDKDFAGYLELEKRLFDKLPDRGHELVIFDLNRGPSIKHILSDHAVKNLAELLKGANQSFNLTVLTNHGTNKESNPHVMMQRRLANRTGIEVTDSGMAWPMDLFSLSHIALPFPPSDPIYGREGLPFSTRLITSFQSAIHAESGSKPAAARSLCRRSP